MIMNNIFMNNRKQTLIYTFCCQCKMSSPRVNTVVTHKCKTRYENGKSYVHCMYYYSWVQVAS